LGRAFDPEIVATFRRIVFPHPVGTEVELLDGRTGVVRVDRGSPDVRTVRLQGADGPVERWPSTGCASSPPERRGGPRARVPP
jgi:hypothetical protein